MSDWQDDAICREIGMELFFPAKAERGVEAKRACMMCDVRVECLDAAMVEEYGLGYAMRFGVRGGYSPHQRFRLASARGEVVTNLIAGVVA